MASFCRHKLSAVTWWLLTSYFILHFSFVHGESRYVVVAPRSLYSGQPYIVSVDLSSNGSDAAVSVTAQISGATTEGGPRQIARSADVTTATSSLRFDNVEQLGPGGYKLLVSGRGSVNFRSSLEVQYRDRFFLPLVQMDRSVYAPGDTVNFRILPVTSRLTPFEPVTLDVRLTDGQGNGIQTWSGLQPNNGVVQQSVQLSPILNYGDWTISMHYRGQVSRHVFAVVQYVLPRFQVTVSLPPYVMMTSRTVTATIRARYDNGLPVRGNLMVRAYPAIRSDQIQPIFLDQVRRNIDIFGTTEVTFDVDNDLRVAADYASRLVFNVIVVEGAHEGTGRSQNATGFTTLYRSKYRLQLIPSASHFKPQLTFTAFLLASTQPGVERQASLGLVTVRHRFSSRSNFSSEEHTVPGSGLVLLRFSPPSVQQSDQLVIQADYAGVLFRFSPIDSAVSPSATFLSVALDTDSAIVGTTVSLVMTSSAPVDEFFYHVVVSGVIVRSATGNARSSLRHDFSLFLSEDMSPKTTVIIYFILGNGEIVSDSIEFAVQSTLTNTVSISLDKTVVSPGSSVLLSIKSLPGSTVALMAVDSQVTNVQGDNDISMCTLAREAAIFSRGRQSDDLCTVSKEARRKMFRTGGPTSNTVFKNAGLDLITNAELPQFAQGSSDLAGGNVREKLAPALAYAPRLPSRLAGPFAFSGLDAPFFSHRREHVLHRPHSTWLMETVTIPRSGLVELTRRTPSETAVFRISAFSLHPTAGLSVIPDPVELRVSGRLQLAVSASRRMLFGELLGVECVVTNLREAPLLVSVAMEHGREWRLASAQPDVNETSQDAALGGVLRREVTVGPGGASSVTFLVEPISVGKLVFTVSARTDFDSDQKIHLVDVEYEGALEEQHLITKLVDMDSERVQFNSSLKIHRSHVNGSGLLLIQASPQLFGMTANQMISSASQLIKLPTGCGEQSLLQLAAATIFLQLQQPLGNSAAAGRLTAVCMRLLREGYQRQLSFRLEDGSFTVFPNSYNSQGSVWLTALAVLWLGRAAKFIDVDSEVVSSGLDFLVRNQHPNGSFTETDSARYSTSQSVDLLTPLVLITLHESGRNQLAQHATDALQYLVRSMPGDSACALAVTSYALSLVGHPAARSALARLMAMSKQRGDERWWSDPVSSVVNNSSYWYDIVRASDVETTSYAVLTYIQRQKKQVLADPAVQQIVNWLIKQMSARGGFISSQDTIVALSALAGISEVSVPSGVEGTVRTLTPANSTQLTVSSAGKSFMTMSKLEEPAAGDVVVQASGRGNFLLQLVHRYHVTVSAPSPSFYLNPKVQQTNSWRKLKLIVCLGWRQAGGSSDMAVVQVALPSGFTADETTLPGIYKHNHVKKAELAENNTKVIIYFERVTEYEVCPTVLAYLTTKVANHRPVPVTVFDYYDTTRTARQFYRVTYVSICDVCDPDECVLYDCEDEDFNGQRLRSSSVEEIESSDSSRFSCNLALNIFIFISVLIYL